MIEDRAIVVISWIMASIVPDKVYLSRRQGVSGCRPRIRIVIW